MAQCENCGGWGACPECGSCPECGGNGCGECRIPGAAEVDDKHRFLNLVRILRSLDMVDLMVQLEDWGAFRDDPYEYIISCADEEAEAIWTALRLREKP